MMIELQNVGFAYNNKHTVFSNLNLYTVQSLLCIFLLLVWLFIRAREKCKGAIAQYISQIIKKQCEMRKRGENIEKEFI